MPFRGAVKGFTRIVVVLVILGGALISGPPAFAANYNCTIYGGWDYDPLLSPVTYGVVVYGGERCKAYMSLLFAKVTLKTRNGTEVADDEDGCLYPCQILGVSDDYYPASVGSAWIFELQVSLKLPPNVRWGALPESCTGLGTRTAQGTAPGLVDS